MLSLRMQSFDKMKPGKRFQPLATGPAIPIGGIMHDHFNQDFP